MFSSVVLSGHQGAEIKNYKVGLVTDIFSKDSSYYWYDILKRSVDLIVSALLLVALSPLFILISALVFGSSSGRIILAQKRLTQGGRIFSMYKFRTMYEEAELQSGPVWASEYDCRVTPLGKILRRTRLDELPQLVNVLLGEMSLIGPRPERPEIAKTLCEEFPFFSRRLAVKGGISGLAQVRLGYASDMRNYRRKLAMDLIYVKNRCLLLDLQIAMSTVLFFIQALTHSDTSGKY